MSLFTIITINKNNSFGLRKTIDSVLSQTYKDFEYFIIDGDSSDDSVDVIKQYYLSKSINLKYISEPDTGIYNAMNKGIHNTSGDFLLFLNSGDIFNDKNVLEECGKLIKDDAELCSGILTLIEKGKEFVLYPPNELSLYQMMFSGLTHPNTFIRRSLFGKYGPYNERNKIVSDWEFFLIAGGLNKCNYQSLDVKIARFINDGISSNPSSPLIINETNQAIERLIPKPILKDINRLHEFETSHSKKSRASVLINRFFL